MDMQQLPQPAPPRELAQLDLKTILRLGDSKKCCNGCDTIIDDPEIMNAHGALGHGNTCLKYGMWNHLESTLWRLARYLSCENCHPNLNKTVARWKVDIAKFKLGDAGGQLVNRAQETSIPRVQKESGSFCSKNKDTKMQENESFTITKRYCLTLPKPPASEVRKDIRIPMMVKWQRDHWHLETDTFIHEFLQRFNNTAQNSAKSFDNRQGSPLLSHGVAPSQATAPTKQKSGLRATAPPFEMPTVACVTVPESALPNVNQVIKHADDSSFSTPYYNAHKILEWQWKNELEKIRDQRNTWSYYDPLQDFHSSHSHSFYVPRGRKGIEEKCRICLQTMGSYEPLDELVWCKSRCGYSFHRTCIDGWMAYLLEHGIEGSCPTCRAKWEW